MATFAASEMAVIVEAFNTHGQQLEAFIEREREFVATASHELRTPLSVVQGAVNITLAEDGLPEAAERRLRRVQDTLDDVEELIAMLLTLAKNPERLTESSESVALHVLAPEIVEQFAALAQGKGLSLKVASLVESTIAAPPQVVQSAIGNLVRNAIEHTHKGEVLVSMEGPASVIIDNPGQTPDVAELAKAYTRLARGGSRDGGGIGLALITRLCNHCGWTLKLDTRPDAGVHFKISFATL